MPRHLGLGGKQAMCGIGGILTRRGDLELRPILGQMLSSLRHRGPDDEGCAEAALGGGFRLGLVHSRLSILDLSAAGHQPMHDAASGSWIVYNGEIYNHALLRRGLRHLPFQSTSDTETILKAWDEQGDGALASLRGMFAFALYDGRRRQFWLVRDRLGIKPLYAAAVGDGTWVFASEVRAILASGLVPRRLSPRAVESYLAFGAITAPWTMLEGVESLLPGESWQFDLESEGPGAGPRKRRYWRVPFAEPNGRLSYDEGLERLRPVLRESLALHMVSDVPVGVFLSGGTDSSSLVATLAYQGYDLQTFSVLFGERDYDESAHARRVAAYFGARHTELPLPPSRMLNELETAVAAYDQPSIDGLNTYFISQAVRQAGIKVAMSGLGGDELFAGYATFGLARWLERPAVRRLARAVQPAMHLLRPGTMRTDKLGAILAGDGSRLETYAILRQVMMTPRRHDLLAPTRTNGTLPLPRDVTAELAASSARLDALNAYSLHELSLYLANMLLRDTDQMSMAHPVEVRVPLLDHVLVEQIASLPGRLKLRRSGRGPAKPLLLDALPERLPPEVLKRQKMGFVFPWELWLRNELKDLVSGIFADRATLQNTGLNAAAVARFWAEFCQSRPGIRYTDILSLVHLLHWARQHKLHV